MLLQAVAFFLVPETAQVPLEQVTNVWLQHWFWRRVSGKRQLLNADGEIGCSFKK